MSSDLPDYTFPISVVAQEIATLAVDIAAQSIGNINVNIAGSDITINVNVTNSTLNVNVQNATLDVNVVNSTLTVEITGTPTINVQTQSGANIVIDKLTEDAYSPRGLVTLQNNADTPEYWVNPAWRGKFFALHSYGMFRRIYIYAKNVGSTDETITLGFSPYPGGEELAELNITIPAGGTPGWYYALLNKWWPYISMHVYVKSLGPNCLYATDTGAPDDRTQSLDGGKTWEPTNGRMWIKCDLWLSPQAMLPVTGFLNVKEVDSIKGGVLDSIWNNVLSGTPVAVDGGAGGNTSTVLYTVPAGKVFWLVAAGLTTRALGTGAPNGHLYVRRGTTSFYLVKINLYTTGDHQTSIFSPAVPFKLQAGDQVVLWSEGNCDSWAWVHGYEATA